MQKGVLSGICILSIIGCTGFSPKKYLGEQHHYYLMQGKSVSYADGYVDGCASGRYDGGDPDFYYYKDQQRYKKEKDYHIGWRQGFKFCQEEWESIKGTTPEERAENDQRVWNEIKK